MPFEKARHLLRLLCSALFFVLLSACGDAVDEEPPGTLTVSDVPPYVKNGESSLTLSGKTDEGARVEIALDNPGASAEPDVMFGPEWNTQITLGEGGNVITVSALDERGNIRLTRRTVFYAPHVKDHTPVSGTAPSVPSSITITFSEAVDASTVTITVAEGSEIKGAKDITAGPAATLTWTPETPLSAGKTYTVTVQANVVGTSGTTYKSPYVWSFTTP